jgi:hypothetical protein
MEKEESFVNEDLNTAFVEGELNKTVNQASTDWNLLDDPNLLEEEDPVNNISNIFTSDKELLTNTNKPLFLESCIRHGTIPTHSASNRIIDEDEDLKDLFVEMTKGTGNPNNLTTTRPQ